MNKYSFQPGWDQVKRKHGSEVRKLAMQKIMDILKITSHDGWIKRKRGMTDPTVDEKAGIDAVFRQYGIRSNICGYETDEYKAANS